MPRDGSRRVRQDGGDITVCSVSAHGAYVHVGGAEPAYVGQQVILGVVGEVVGLADGEGRVGGDVGFGPERVADPPDTQFSNPGNALHAGDGGGGPVNKVGVDSIHEPGSNLADR